MSTDYNYTYKFKLAHRKEDHKEDLLFLYFVQENIFFHTVQTIFSFTSKQE